MHWFQLWKFDTKNCQKMVSNHKRSNLVTFLPILMQKYNFLLKNDKNANFETNQYTGSIIIMADQFLANFGAEFPNLEPVHQFESNLVFTTNFSS